MATTKAREDIKADLKTLKEDLKTGAREETQRLRDKAAEAELVIEGGTQVAALAWARSANVVGMDTPSLSRVGDALQFAELFGDQVGDSFAPKDREVRDIATPDPCERFGPRNQPGGFITRAVTGLYVPETQGVRSQTPQ